MHVQSILVMIALSISVLAALTPVSVAHNLQPPKEDLRGPNAQSVHIFPFMCDIDPLNRLCKSTHTDESVTPRSCLEHSDAVAWGDGRAKSYCYTTSQIAKYDYRGVGTCFLEPVKKVT
jgi:hypothetical protein